MTGGKRSNTGIDRARSSDDALAPDDRIAVALRYEHGADAAPRVTATGKGYVADRIRALALDSGVHVKRDANLAQLLATVDLNSEIPLEAYVAVAEIFNYIYRADRIFGEGLGDVSAADAMRD